MTIGFTAFETNVLYGIIGISAISLLYAVLLVREILREDRGTKEMQKIGNAIRTGANVYLRKQFRGIIMLILFLTVALYFTAQSRYIGIGRAAAFLMGAIFSYTVGYVGMNIATRTNERVAELAVKSKDMQPQKAYRAPFDLAYKGGIVTGAVCEGLGLLGWSARR